ncbi:thaumatin [Mycena filopes]|nr:thaumatin [Mycena filopes]
MISLTVALVLASTAAARSLTVVNSCSYTIWPALFTSSGGHPSHPTGWEAAANSRVQFDVPSDWDGRVWGRRACNFATNPGANSCVDGGCNGGLHCDVNTGTGVPPATLAEFNFNGGGTDFYDVSLVDGFNLPMKITNNVGCDIGSCPVDLNANCPGAQKGPFNSAGVAVGCKSACTVDALAGKAANSPNCCSGTHDTAATCPPSGVTNYKYFKNNCPRSYAYAYDESSGTALWTCPTAKSAAYTITFCP